MTSVRRRVTLPTLLAPKAYDPVNEQQFRSSIEDRLRATEGATDPGGTSSSSITFQQDGTGSVVRNAEEKLKELGISAEDFGCVGDGTVDDAANLQLAVNYARSQGAWLDLNGNYRHTSGLDIYPSTLFGIRWRPGASLMPDFTGADEVAVKATHPTVPSTRGSGLVLSNPRIELHSNIGSSSIGPCLFEMRYASGLKIAGEDGFLSHFRNNSAFRISGAFNCNLGPMSLWGAGANYIRKTTTGITFSLTSGTKALSTNAPHFDGTEVGNALMLDGTPDELVVIASVLDSQNATTVENAKQTFTAKSGVWDGITITINASSNSGTISHNVLSSANIGHVVYILGAMDLSGGVTGPFRTTITGVSGTTITFADSVTASVTDAYIVFAPAVEIYGEDTSNNVTNDLLWRDMHIELHRGCGLALTHAVDLNLQRAKIHAQNDIWTTNASTFNMIAANAYGVVDGIFEGTTVNKIGRIYASGQRSTLYIPEWQGIGINGQPLVGGDGFHSNGKIGIGPPILVNNPSLPNTTLPFSLSGVGRIFQRGEFSTNSGAIAPPMQRGSAGSAFQAAALPVVRFEHGNSGTIASGIGVSQEFSVATAANRETIALLEAILTDVTGGSEDADFVFKLMAAGASASEVVRFLSSGGIQTSLIRLGNTGLRIADTNASHDLTIAPGANITGARTLTLTTPDANQTIDTATAGAITVDSSTFYAGIPQNSQSADYTLVLSDAQKHILHPAADNNPRTFTIPANSSVAYPVGTVITFINEINTITIAITSDTLTLAGTGGTGSRTLAASGMATAVKIASTSWMISGSGIS